MEFHPELAWARLGGAILPSKHTAAGILARLRLLRPCVPGIDVIDTVHVEASASPGIDDLLDAVVGLCVAAGIVAKLSPPYRLPVQNPPVDSKGLRMEIWY
jgi:predicted RNase H-like nuclease